MANNADYVIAKIQLEGALKEYFFKSKSSLVTMNDGKTLEATITAITNAIEALPTGSDVTKAINDAIAAAISSVYKPKGSIATMGDLPELTAANEGNVYNIEAAFTTTADFKEGAGKKYGAGQNVAIVNVGDDENPEYKYDALAGFIDVSNFVEKETGKSLMTDEEKTKLAGIDEGANKYVHPENHSADMITPTDNKQFLSKAEKADLLGRKKVFTSETEPSGMEDGDIWFQPVSTE